MTTEMKDSVPAAALFNNFVADWGTRTNEFINHLILIDGGILSITIGAFLNSKIPKLDATGIHEVQTAWLLLSSSLVLALLTAILRIIAQRIIISRWGKLMKSDGPPEVVVIEGNHLFRIILWLIQGLAFLSCVGGIIAISHGASQLLRQQP